MWSLSQQPVSSNPAQGRQWFNESHYNLQHLLTPVLSIPSTPWTGFPPHNPPAHRFVCWQLWERSITLPVGAGTALSLLSWPGMGIVLPELQGEPRRCRGIKQAGKKVHLFPVTCPILCLVLEGINNAQLHCCQTAPCTAMWQPVIDCHCCQSFLTLLLCSGRMFALCLLFYNPQRWNFIA